MRRQDGLIDGMQIPKALAVTRLGFLRQLANADFLLQRSIRLEQLNGPLVGVLFQLAEGLLKLRFHSPDPKHRLDPRQKFRALRGTGDVSVRSGLLGHPGSLAGSSREQ